MNNSIVQMEDGPDKVSRAHVIALLRRAGDLVRAQEDALEAKEEAEDAHSGVDNIDDPLLDFLTPAEISAHYRGQMPIFEPKPAADRGRAHQGGSRLASGDGGRSSLPADGRRTSAAFAP